MQIDRHASLRSTDSPPGPKRILIIDDEALIRRSLADYLSECGYETVTAPDGSKGLARAKEEHFDAVLVDLRMPHIDGLEVITTLKKEQPELPVVVVSGTGVLSDAIEAIRQGAWDYITKPIQDMGEIEVVIDRILEKARLCAERDSYQQEIEQLNRSLEAEVARQVQDLQAQNRELTALNRVAGAISAPLDLDTMLTRAIDAAIDAIDADGGVVHLLNPATRQLDIVAACGIPETLLEQNRSAPLEQGFIGRIAQLGRSYTCSDFPDDPQIKIFKDAGYRACLGVPLRAGDETEKKYTIVGTLNIVMKAEREFDPHEIELLTAIGNQIGVAVARTQYASDLQQANIQLELLLAQVQEQAEQVQQIINTVPEGVLLLDTNRQIILANPEASESLAILTTTKTGETLTDLGDSPIAELLTPPPQGLWHEVTAGGRRFEIIARPIETGPTPGWVLVIRDVTEEREVERRVLQQERLAAVGQLAAGIAHDFNNLLTVINGYSEFLLQRYVDKDEPAYKDIQQIHKAGERASVLTRKLLAFSRQQVIQPAVLDLNNIITDTNELLHRLISEDIELTIKLDPVLGWVRADLGQIEQIIMNLTINACDAMSQGGKLTIETSNINLTPRETERLVDLKPGPYVKLTISDTGTGMDAETLSHIFEPFFTTKEQGKGTGLGLATVYGIVQQNGGSISVTSQTGKGTTFEVYLPRLDESEKAVKPAQTSPQSRQGTETVLLVEDEAMVRELVHYALHDSGYQVLEATHGKEALQIARQHDGPIDLLLTDVVMPGGMSGRELSEALTAIHTDIKVLFMSGYADYAIVLHGVLEPNLAFLQKPFTLAALTQKVRETLDAP